MRESEAGARRRSQNERRLAITCWLNLKKRQRHRESSGGGLIDYMWGISRHFGRQSSGFVVVVVLIFALLRHLLDSRRLDLAELHGAIQGRRLGAGKGVVLVVAGEGLLVKDGPVAADKAPLGVLDDLALVVLDGQADVEDLAVVVHVAVVAVALALAAEAVLVGLLQDLVRAAGQDAGHVAVLPTDQDKSDSGHQDRSDAQELGCHCLLLLLLLLW